MAVRVHHLDCGTMCPRGAAALGLADPAHGRLVCHCLLIEAGEELVLLDTGFGTGDVADPSRLGVSRHVLNARLDPAQTAVAQVRALGFDPADVRHVLVTHLDLDHAGGLGDFPEATVHVHAEELAFARGRSRDARLRYRSQQWAHGPRWEEHRAADGEAWLGFPRARLLEGLGVELAMIPLHGHTAGHAGFALRDGDGWLLHAGDAYLRHEEIATPPRASRGLRAYHRLNSTDAALRDANVGRLADLARDHAEVTVFCAHDAGELARSA